MNDTLPPLPEPALCTIAPHDPGLPEPVFYCCPKTGVVRSLAVLRKYQFPGYWAPCHYEETIVSALAARATAEITEPVAWRFNAHEGTAFRALWIYEEESPAVGNPFTHDALYLRSDPEVAKLRAEVEDLRKTLRALSFAAQTTGGTAGQDEGLCAAIASAEAALAEGQTP